jgi:hypothetical protein|tara:strand:- start:5987 stop:6148 length:162 start_codon:yes stop_codon:yes gene_type:complete
MNTMNIRCALGAMQSLFSNQKNFNMFRQILKRFRQWLNNSDEPKYLSGKEKLK